MQLFTPAEHPAHRTTLTIDRRFCGPPGAGHGGYVSACLEATGPARVVFRNPVPLDRPLTVDTRAGQIELRDGARVLVEAAPGLVPEPLALTVGADSIMDQAPVAQPDEHPFPGCFVCGPGNQQGLGMSFRRLGSMVGDVFTPPIHEGAVAPASIVGALDCTSGWASFRAGEAGVLGTIEYAVVGRAAPGQRLIAIGAPDGKDGRKRFARSSVFTDDGHLVATARTTWIEIQPPRGTGRTLMEQPVGGGS